MKHYLIKAALIFLAFWAGHATAAVEYVNAGNKTPGSPYSSWATAATNIQNAVSVANAGDTVLVTNGTYSYGGQVIYSSLNNRVAITKAITLQSVNGAGATIIQGNQVAGTTNGTGAVRCVYLAGGAVLNGFTLTRGATLTTGDYVQGQSGGGVLCADTNELVENCFFTNNAANSLGGGIYSGLATNCIFQDNSAYDGGGGVLQLAR